MENAVDSAALVVELITALKNINYGSYAISTLVWYEHIITLQDEVNLVWHRKWNISTWIFAASRYLLLAIVLVLMIPENRKLCENRALQLVFQVISNIPAPLLATIFSSIRVFALLDHNFRVAGLVFLVGLVSVGINIYFMFYSVNVFVAGLPGLGGVCQELIPISSVSATAASNLSRTSTSALILQDIIVVLVTWRKTYRNIKAVKAVNMDLTLSAVVFRDGSLHFLMLLCINIGTLFPFAQNPLAALPAIIPLVLISRFILDLRQVDQQNTAATTHVVGSSSLNFRMPAAHGVVGNMGESLVFAGDNLAWGDMEDVTDDDDARYWSEDALWETPKVGAV